MRGGNWGGALLLAVALGCGGEEPMAEEHHESAATSGHEEPRPDNGGVEVEGLMGTISQMAVQQGIEPRMGRFLRCFTHRYDEVEVLGGHFEMAFRIDREGNVKWVYPRASTIGDRPTERCLLETAAGIRFSRPQGGEAEFGYPLDLDPPEDVRPPTYWDPSRVQDAVDRQASAVQRCGGSGFAVTVYVEPGGRVIAAGAASRDQSSPEDLDCVADVAMGFEMPDPGSYPAKVSFEL